MKTKHLLFVGVILLLFACDSEDSLKTESDSYLPLQVGNSWEFESTNQNAKDTYYFKRVTAIVNMNFRDYYEIISGWGTKPGAETILDTAYYHISDNGFVYVRRRSSDSDENRFRLFGEDGDTWSYPVDDMGEANITLSVSTMHLGNKKLEDCKAYYLDISRMADEEYTITLAEGIGFVKEHSDAWGSGSILKTATINGQTINF